MSIYINVRVFFVCVVKDPPQTMQPQSSSKQPKSLPHGLDIDDDTNDGVDLTQTPPNVNRPNPNPCPILMRQATGKIRPLRKQCGYCGKKDNLDLKLCSLCFGVYYCGKECQKSDWRRHKYEECDDMRFIRDLNKECNQFYRTRNTK